MRGLPGSYFYIQFNAVIMAASELFILHTRQAFMVHTSSLETEEIIKYGLTINHCRLPVYQVSGPVLVKGADSNCWCFSNTNHIGDKNPNGLISDMFMSRMLSHLSYKWISVPKFDQTNSSFYRAIRHQTRGKLLSLVTEIGSPL